MQVDERVDLVDGARAATWASHKDVERDQTKRSLYRTSLIGRYQKGKVLEAEKIDVGRFGSPPSWQVFPSLLQMLCAKMCALDTGCKGRLHAV